MLRRNGPVVKSVESVLRLEGSPWGERFVEEVWHVSSSSGVATSVSELLYPCYFTLLLLFTQECRKID